MDHRKPLNIIIVGGSLSAFFAAIPLKRQGHNIHILESATSVNREGLLSGIGLLGHTRRWLDKYDRLSQVPFGTPNYFLETLDQDMSIRSSMQMGDKGTGNLMTSWDATYYRLKANFDGLVNPLCNEPPAIETGEGVAVFETGKKAIKVDEAENRMKVTVQDVVTGESQTYISDIVIAADGFNSTIRYQLHPTIHRDEPGYLLWRGTVPLKALSPAIRARIENKTMVYPMHCAYALFYTIPAENGSLMPEDRQINFVWYDYPTPTHASTADILTDTDGHTHRTTLPIGKMRPEAWARQVARAKDVMHPDLFTIVDKITQPFVTAISSVEYPHAKYFNDKLFFIGDALVQLQPNTGHGTAHAALEAMMLADVFEGKVTAAEWEEKVVEEAKVQRARSRNFPKQWLEDSGTGERVLL